jgi:hypothetical protein
MGTAFELYLEGNRHNFYWVKWKLVSKETEKKFQVEEIPRTELGGRI